MCVGLGASISLEAAPTRLHRRTSRLSLASACNMTLPAAAARAPVYIYTDRYMLHARGKRQMLIDDRRTDVRTPIRYIWPCTSYMREACHWRQEKGTVYPGPSCMCFSTESQRNGKSGILNRQSRAERQNTFD